MAGSNITSTVQVANVDELKALIAKAETAQHAFAKFPQDKVDAIFKAAALAADAASIQLAEEAVAETGMGNVEDKITKNRYAAEFIYSEYRDTKTAGIIEKDVEKGYMKVAEPLGVLAAIVPCTNPTSTAIFKCLLALKTRNALIFSPHPRAKACTAHAVEIVYRAAVEAGAPQGILACLAAPSVETSSSLMKLCDSTLATGGPGMVASAYSSGKPALGVGPGNVSVLVDSSADLTQAASCIIHSKSFDNGVICASEQNCVFAGDRTSYRKFVNELTRLGAYFVKPEDMDKFRAVLMRRNPKDPTIMSASPAVTGKTPAEIGKLAGVEVPESARMLVGEITDHTPAEAWAHEKLSPCLSLIRADNFDSALAICEELVEHGGHGHTAALHIDPSNTRQIEKFALTMETCRILINSPSSQGGIGGIYSDAIRPSLTLGCGSWGGNSTWENIGVNNLLNIKTVTLPTKVQDDLIAPKELLVGKDALKKGLTSFLKGVNGPIAILWSTGAEKALSAVESKLDKSHRKNLIKVEIKHTWDRAFALKVATQLKRKKIVGIIAVGDDDAFCCAKAARILIDCPRADFEALSRPFISESRRILDVPVSSISLMTVATTAWARTGVSQTLCLSDRGVRYNVISLNVLPQVAVVDKDLIKDSKVTRYSAPYAAMARLVSAACSVTATPTVLKLAGKGIRAASKILANKGSTQRDITLGISAALATSNSFGGIVDALSEGVSQVFSVPLDLAYCALLPACLAQSLNPAPSRMGTARFYLAPQGAKRVAALAVKAGLKGSKDEDQKACVAAFTDWISSVRVVRHLPAQMADLGLTPSELKKSASKAVDIAMAQESVLTAPVAARKDRVLELLNSLL